VHKYAHLSLQDDPGLIIDWGARWDWPALGRVLGSDLFEELFPDPDEPFPEVRAIIGSGEGGGGFLEATEPLSLARHSAVRFALQGGRMSMAHGLEVRVPMLSNAMLAYAGQLPLAMRTRGRRTKEPLRTIAETLAPTLARSAPKRGFSFPLDGWMRPIWPVTGVGGRLRPACGHRIRRPGAGRLVEQYDAAARRDDQYRAATLAIRLFDLMLLALWGGKAIRSMRSPGCN